MASTISPNMNLIVPGVGTEPGPTWANDLNSDLGILDQHNHSTGQGVQITPSGLNINSNLAINSNNLTTVKTVNFIAQSTSLAGTSPNLGCLYVAGNELYYNDETGNVVPITHTGSVNSGAGSITGLPSGTASASFNASTQTFVWQSATSTPANLDAGSVIFRNITSGSAGLTVNPPNVLSSSYAITLPPTNSAGSTSFLTYDTSNNIGIGPSTINGISASNISASAGLNPSGAIIMYGGSSIPTGWLLCDGSAISRTTFSALFTAIGTAYGVGNGTTTFNVPDLRGLFPRGVDNGAGNDPDTASRTAINGGNSGDNVGSYEADALEQHGHNAPTTGSGAGGNSVTMGNPQTNTQQTAYSVINASASTETRPKNLYVNFIIKT